MVFDGAEIAGRSLALAIAGRGGGADFGPLVALSPADVPVGRHACVEGGHTGLDSRLRGGAPVRFLGGERGGGGGEPRRW